MIKKYGNHVSQKNPKQEQQIKKNANIQYLKTW